MKWRTGDTGRVRCGLGYRVICDDAKGDRGPIIALVDFSGDERSVRYDAEGVHHGQPRAYDLEPPKAKA